MLLNLYCRNKIVIAGADCDNAPFLSVCFLRTLELGSYGKIFSSLKSKMFLVCVIAEKGGRECSLGREQCVCKCMCLCGNRPTVIFKKI